jgi:hypothetical protein
MRKTSLTTRAFLFSFVPVCVVLAATFVALNALVEQRVKQGLRDSIELRRKWDRCGFDRTEPGGGGSRERVADRDGRLGRVGRTLVDVLEQPTSW